MLSDHHLQVKLFPYCQKGSNMLSCRHPKVVSEEVAPAAGQLEAVIPYDFLYLSRHQQVEALRRELAEGRILMAPGEKREPPGGISPWLPNVLLISLGLTTEYGVGVLRDRLLNLQGVACYVRDMRYLDAYLKEYGSFEGEAPDIVTLSITDDQIENANRAISRIRQIFPQAYVLLGGPTSQTAEQLACLIPDFDMLIKGDGDKVLPRLARIIGKQDRRQGLNQNRLQAIRGLAGGILVRTRNKWLAHNLHRTNMPSAYHLPRPEKRKAIHYWHTSRGCPYDCRFCAHWSGRLYRCVTPREGDDPARSLAERSATAMRDGMGGGSPLSMVRGRWRGDWRRQL